MLALIAHEGEVPELAAQIRSRCRDYLDSMIDQLLRL
jgi:hypothetical protein